MAAQNLQDELDIGSSREPERLDGLQRPAPPTQKSPTKASFLVILGIAIFVFILPSGTKAPAAPAVVSAPTAAVAVTPASVPMSTFQISDAQYQLLLQQASALQQEINTLTKQLQSLEAMIKLLQPTAEKK